MEALRGHRERKQRVLSPAGGQNTHRGPGSGQALREHRERKQRVLSPAGAEHAQGDGQRAGPAGTARPCALPAQALRHRRVHSQSPHRRLLC